ncbi:MAG: hypothetical protein JNM07_03680 [Phycisphaerae bacterium]|nr:hypothetical protein [Phycisphaerae bacterium]
MAGSTRIATMLTVLITTPLVVAGVVAAWPGSSGPTCWEQKWLNTTVVCDGACSAGYSVCPGRVLCMAGNVNKKADPVITGPFPCQWWTGPGITGTCPNCVGGSLTQPATETVNIPHQECVDACP